MPASTFVPRLSAGACRAKFLSHCGAEPPSSCAEPQDRMAGGDGSVYVLTQTDFVLLALLAFVCLYMIPRRVYRWVRGGGGRSEDKGDHLMSHVLLELSKVHRWLISRDCKN